ncbi:MAG: hypothetical protein ACREJN_07600 [Nitrospiraceae bacterium]
MVTPVRISVSIPLLVMETPPLDNTARLEAELNAYGASDWEEELVLVDIGNVTKPVPRFIFNRVELP